MKLLSLISHFMKSNLIFVAFMLLAAMNCSYACSAEADFEGKLVIANDQRFMLAKGAGRVRDNPRPGAVTLLDFSTFPPEKVSLQDVPCSVIGPPSSIAITPDGKTIVVTCSMKVDPDDPKSQIPDNVISVLSFEEGMLKLKKSITVGRQPAGVAISRDGGMALVANRADGTVTLLEIESGNANILDNLKIADPDDEVSDVEFLACGKRALATVSNSEQHRIAILSVSDKKLIDDGRIYEVGAYPYEVDVSPDGKVALAANVRPWDNTIAVIDLTRVVPVVVDKIYTAPQPECIRFSPDGKYVAVSCLNYSNRPLDDPQRNEQGRVFFMKRIGMKLKILEEMIVDPLPQAAIFSPDGKYLIISSYEKKQLKFYRIKGDSLEDTGLLMDLPGHPAAMKIAD